MQKLYKVAIIGSTGKGNYGHHLDTAFKGLSGIELVAVADDNSAGLAHAGTRLEIPHLYLDYKKMLQEEQPDIVCISPSWVTERVPMVQAAANVGCHIYCDKPAAGSLVEIDTMVDICNRNKVKMALAHQWRAMLPIQKTLDQIKAEKFGKLLRMRARPKDDSRGGGEELLLHGTHLFDLMIALAGKPHWASGHISVDGRDATLLDTKQGNSPVGPIIGDSISAIFGFDNGVRGFFDSTADLASAAPSPSGLAGNHLFGLSIECEWATLELREPGEVYIYAAPRVLPDLENLHWEKVWIQGWHDQPGHEPHLIRKNFLSVGNQILAQDLINAIEENREPLSSIQTVRFVHEMVQGVYASHLADGHRITIPLTERTHPLEKS